MAAKTVIVEATVGNDFKLEGQLGKHTIYIDQPEAAGGGDAGPNPLQVFLFSLAGCISAIGRIVANQQRLDIRGMKIKVSGEFDSGVLLGQNKEDRAGFSAINVDVDIDSDMTGEEKKAFLEEVDSRCPLSDNIRNNTNISVSSQV